MRYLVSTLIVSLLALIALVYYQGRSAGIQKTERETENKLHQQRVSEIQAAHAKDRARFERIQKDGQRKDSIFQASINAQKQKTARTEKRAAELRPQIDQLADSVKELAQFLALNDSLNLSKDATIVKLEERIDTLQRSHSQEVKLLQDQILALTNEAVDDQNYIADLNERLTKAESKSRKRWSVGLTGGYSVVEHQGEVFGGPGVTAGIGYRLFSF